LKIAFRTDASLQIGTGQVMRCLTLADALRERGARCTFICRLHSGHLLDMVTQRGHHAVALLNGGATTALIGWWWTITPWTTAGNMPFAPIAKTSWS
jgi:hypothetical protein